MSRAPSGNRGGDTPREAWHALRQVFFISPFGKVHNVGSDQEISIQGVAEKVKSMTGSDSPIVKVPYEEAYAPGFEDVSRRVPDTSRIHSLLSWKPRHSLEQTLETVMRYEAERMKADSGAAELSEEVR